MTNKAVKAVRQRRRVYRKYKDTTQPAYIKAAKAACASVKTARRNFEEQLARKIKNDRKSFYEYVRSKSKSSGKIRSLENDHGQLISKTENKVEVLNEFFCSVFTGKMTPTYQPQTHVLLMTMQTN